MGESQKVTEQRTEKPGREIAAGGTAHQSGTSAMNHTKSQTSSEEGDAVGLEGSPLL